MARSKNPESNRRLFRVTKDEAQKMRLQGARLGGTAALLRSLLEKFVSKGSDFAAPEMVSVEMIADPSMIVAAERRAREEYGVSLREILRHELAKLPDAPA